jgi:hypothetical protein
MSDDVIDQLGPVDYLVVEFPAGKAKFDGSVLEQLTALVDAGIIKVLDLLIIKKEADGTFDGFEVHEFDDDAVGVLRELGAEAAELLAVEDVEFIAEALEPDTVAAVLVWENTWAVPFAVAVREAGGQLVANGRIPMQAILAAVEADVEAAETEGA